MLCRCSPCGCVSAPAEGLGLLLERGGRLAFEGRYLPAFARSRPGQKKSVRARGSLTSFLGWRNPPFVTTRSADAGGAGTCVVSGQDVRPFYYAPNCLPSPPKSYTLRTPFVLRCSGVVIWQHIYSDSQTCDQWCSENVKRHCSSEWYSGGRQPISVLPWGRPKLGTFFSQLRDRKAVVVLFGPMNQRRWTIRERNAPVSGPISTKYPMIPVGPLP